MTKQFTIPCQFGQQTSPVTFYIGHPDNGHHPIHFQSTWLSSSKGGTVPQDLMNTLQQLHDLSIQNNADFEELCYYALITATTKAVNSGVSPDDIKHYANEYIEKESTMNENGEDVEGTTTKIGTSQIEQEAPSQSNSTIDDELLNENNNLAETEDFLNNSLSNDVSPASSLEEEELLMDDDLFITDEQNKDLSKTDSNNNPKKSEIITSNELLQEEEDLIMNDDLFNDTTNEVQQNKESKEISSQATEDDELLMTDEELDDDYIDTTEDTELNEEDLIDEDLLLK